MTNPTRDPKRWEKPRLIYQGTVDEVVQLGGGKFTATGGDPGEPRKQIPLE